MSEPGRSLVGMSTFTDPLEPESFEHNGQHPEVDENDAIDGSDGADRAPSTGTEATDEPDSFDENLETEFKTFIGDAEPADGPAPAG
jgi:hypothetical protein